MDSKVGFHAFKPGLKQKQNTMSRLQHERAKMKVYVSTMIAFLNATNSAAYQDTGMYMYKRDDGGEDLGATFKMGM